VVFNKFYFLNANVFLLGFFRDGYQFISFAIKGAVSRCFSAIFDIAGLKPWLSTIAHTRNAPRTSRERYQEKYWRKGELQFISGYFIKPKWQNLKNST